jgi:hypothetical protein
MYFYALWLALRARSPSYFTAVNPVMKYSGAFAYSKYELLSRIEPRYRPVSIRVSGQESKAQLAELLKAAGLEYPLIAKPDAGERGKSVELVRSPEELNVYFREHRPGREKHSDPEPSVLLQEFVETDREIGLLYYRMPDGSAEEVTSVVIREFLRVEGDGKSSLSELIHSNLRAAKRKDYLLNRFRDRLAEIPSEGETILLEPIGNHNRGTTFRNGNHLINERLVRLVHDMIRPLEGFYYGRLDLKLLNPDSLETGEGIRILELNGVNSEPAHIYHPGFPLLKAYAVIGRHMRIILKIAMQNHRKGVPYSPFWRMYRDLRTHLSELRQY